MKKAVRCELSRGSNAWDWKRTLARSLNNEFPDGVRKWWLNLVSDTGSQSVSVGLLKVMATLGMEQIFSSYDNP